MRQLLSLLFAAILLTSLSGCISLKSEYPDVTYYGLKPSSEPPSMQQSQLDGVLLVRQFLSHAEFRGDNIVVLRDSSELDRYHYHRWIEEPSTLIADMLLERSLQSQLFNGGVIQGASQVLPNYFVEGRVIEMLAGEGRPPQLEDMTGRVRAWAKVRVHFTLVKIEEQRTERNVVLQKIYEATVPRYNRKVYSIAPAMGVAAGNVVDQFISEMATVLR